MSRRTSPREVKSMVSGAIYVPNDVDGIIRAERKMIYDCGMTASGVSLSMGTQRTWLSSAWTRRSRPFADTLARIADACGYELWLVPNGRDAAEAVVSSAIGPALDEAADAFKETAMYALTHRNRKRSL